MLWISICLPMMAQTKTETETILKRSEFMVNCLICGVDDPDRPTDWYKPGYECDWDRVKLPLSKNNIPEWSADNSSCLIRKSVYLEEYSDQSQYYLECNFENVCKVWINGQELIGRKGSSNGHFSYIAIPKNVIKKGSNLIAIESQRQNGKASIDFGLTCYHYSENLGSIYNGSVLPRNKVTDYYLYNPASGMWLQNNDRLLSEWNTRAQLGTRGIEFALTHIYKNYDDPLFCTIDGKFKSDEGKDAVLKASNLDLATYDENKDQWLFEPITVTGSDKVFYKITHCSPTQGDYMLSATQLNIDAKQVSKGILSPGPSEKTYLKAEQDKNDDYCLWQLVSREERLKLMEELGKKQIPQDASWLIPFNDKAEGDARVNQCTNENFFIQNYTQEEKDKDLHRCYNVIWSDPVVEHAKFENKLTGLPNGRYTLQVQGCYCSRINPVRSGQTRCEITHLLDKVNAHIYFNDKKNLLMSVADIPFFPYQYFKKYEEFGDPNYPEFYKGFTEIPVAGYVMALGEWVNRPMTTVVTDGTINISVVKDGMNKNHYDGKPSNDHAILGDMKLVYLGPIPEEPVTFKCVGGTGEAPENVLNGPEKAWVTKASGENYVIIEASESIFLNDYTLTTASDIQPKCNPLEWELFATNDPEAKNQPHSTAWKSIQRLNSLEKMPASPHTAAHFPMNPLQEPYRYFMLRVIRNKGGEKMQLGNLQLHYSLTAKDTPILVRADGAELGGYPQYLFDGNTNTPWKHHLVNNRMIIFSTSKPINAKKMAMVINNNDEETPAEFRLYGAKGKLPRTDGGLDGWTLIHQNDDRYIFYPFEKHSMVEINLNKPGEYEHFLLDVYSYWGILTFNELIVFDDQEPITNSEEYAAYAKEYNSGKDWRGVRLAGDGICATEPLGTVEHPFHGVYDGQGHTINVAINAPEKDFQGLIGCATTQTTVKDVIVNGETIKGRNCVGGLIGGMTRGGNLTVQRCGTDVKVDATGDGVGGILGQINDGTYSINMQDVYNIGSVSTSGKHIGSLIGWAGQKPTVKNAYNCGKVTGDNAKFVGCESEENISNTYDINKEQFTETQLFSGELCYKLGSAFTQNLDVDSRPTFGTLAVHEGSWFGEGSKTYYNKVGDQYTINRLQLSDGKRHTWDVPQDGTIMAHHLKFKRHTSTEGFAAVCLPFSTDVPANWYVVALNKESVVDNRINLHFARTTRMEAGIPYMVKGTSMLNKEFTNCELAHAPGQIDLNSVVMKGNFGITTVKKGDYYITNLGGLSRVDHNEIPLMPFRAYLSVKNDSDDKQIIIVEEDDPTGIEHVFGNPDNEPKAIYNMAGQRLKAPVKGLNIINGKKVVLK